MDALDDLDFPTAGTLAELRYEYIDPGRSGADNFSLLHFSGVHAIPLRQNALVFNAQYVRSFDRVVGRHFQSSLGGFKNLSGLYDGAFVGNDLAYFSLTFLQRLIE